MSKWNINRPNVKCHRDVEDMNRRSEVKSDPSDIQHPPVNPCIPAQADRIKACSSRTLLAFLFTLLFSLLSAVPGNAEYRVIHTEPVRYTDLAPGVRHELHRVFTDEGWIVVNLVRTASDAKTSLVPLYTKRELTTPKTLSELVRAREGIVAAINGDYFDYKTASVLGRIIDRGQWIQSSNRDGRFANFYVERDGTAAIGYEDGVVGKLSTATALHDVDYVNKLYTDWDSLLLFDGNFGDKAPALPGGADLIVQIRVEDGIVKTILRSDEARAGEYLDISAGSIAEGDFVIYAKGTRAQPLMHLKEGDEVRFFPAAIPYTSISGGAQLVKDGKIVGEFSHNVQGEHPRTAVGVEKDGRTTMLLTVNGRSNSYRGIRQSELAELMLRLGAHQAMILDGGGSTEMMIADPYSDKDKIVSFLSDGSERKIFNGLSVRVERETNPTEDLKKIMKLRFVENKLNGIVGVPMRLQPEAIDGSYRAYGMNVEDIAFESLGVEGIFRDGYFIPSASGDGVISASVNGVKAYVDVHVSKRAIKMDVKRDSGRFRFYLHSEDGYLSELDSRLVEVVVPEGKAQFDPEQATLTLPDPAESGYVTFSYNSSGDHTVTANVSFGSGRKIVSVENFESYELTSSPNKGIYLGIYPNPNGTGKVGALEFSDLQGKPDTKHIRYFREYITIRTDVRDMLVDVYADVYAAEAKDLKLSFLVESVDGSKRFVPVVDGIDREGWKTIRIPGLKKGDQFKVFSVQAASDKGVIYFDNFRVEGDESATADSAPKDISYVKTPADYRIDSNFPSYRISYDAKRTDEEALRQRFHFLEIDNGGGYIRKHDGYAQWRSLLDTLAGAKKPVMIKFSDTYYFPDKEAMNLLFEAVESCPQPVCMVFKAYKGGTDIFMHRKACIIEIKEKTEALEISEDLQIQLIEIDPQKE